MYSGIYDYLEESTRPGEKIAYTLSVRSYLFYGKDISRKVVYEPPTMTDSAAWIEKLRKDGVTMLAVGPLGDWQSMPERRSIEALGGAFTRVFGDDITKNPVLYRLEPGIL